MSDDTASQTPAKATALKLVSRLKYPYRLKLTNGETVFIAAHGTIDNIDAALVDIDSLSSGIHLVEFQD